MKGLNFVETNCPNTTVALTETELIVKIDLTGDPSISSKGNPMASKCRISGLESPVNKRKLHGFLNLNYTVRKADVQDENEILKAKLAEMEAKLAGK